MTGRERLPAAAPRAPLQPSVCPRLLLSLAQRCAPAYVPSGTIALAFPRRCLKRGRAHGTFGSKSGGQLGHCIGSLLPNEIPFGRPHLCNSLQEGPETRPTVRVCWREVRACTRAATTPLPLKPTGAPNLTGSHKGVALGLSIKGSPRQFLADISYFTFNVTGLETPT